MNISEMNIRRPVMTTLVMLGILLFGYMSYRLLPVSDLPNVDFPTIQVFAALPGASPETMASAVATPLEKQFSTIAGVDSMTSSSALGSTSITLQFSLTRRLEDAAQDVQAAIAQAARQLPPDMPTPPSYRKVNPADQPILFIALTSSDLKPSELDEYGQTTMAQRISTVNGVAQVQVYGSQKYAVRVQLDPYALASRKIGIDEVAAAVMSGNVNLPTGTLYGLYRAFTVQATGQLNDAKSYRPLIVAYRKGFPTRLQELGRTIDSVENDKVAAWYCDANGQHPSVVLAVQRQPGTNTVEVADAVKKLLPVFREQLPASVSMHILHDSSVYIRESAQDVEFTLLLTLALVVMVIFVFLRNLSATVIPSLTLPMSIVGTFAVMYLLGYSLDNLSLMALTLSVGFVVDDAIVMLENIVRHMEMGKGRMQASLDGSREIGFTIVSMTLSLAAVFIPILFMGGLVGRLFREFAVVIGVAVLVSGFVSLTLTPMLSSRFLRPPATIHHGRIYAASERVFQWMVRFYGWTLRGVLRHRLGTIAVSVGILVGTVKLFQDIPKGFLPSEDRAMLFAFTEAAEGISPTSMFQHQQAVASIIQKDQNVHAFMSAAGGMAGATASNTGMIFIKLKPKEQRPLTADEVVESLRQKLNTIPGIKVLPQNLPPIMIGGRLTKSQYQYALQGPDTKELFTYAVLLESAVRALEGFEDVASDLQIKNPQVNVEILRDKASSLGVTAAQIENALYYAYGSRQISTILASNNQYQVILELDPNFQMDPSALPMLYVRSSAGELVPLSAVANITNTMGPLTINHSGQLPSVTISFNLKPGTALGDAVKKVDDLARRMLPATITTSFQGTAQAFQSSMENLGLLGIMAVVVIYIVLGILYESFIHPLTILTALPFAGFGALLTLRIFNVELSLYAYVGLIMLVGLVKKNGIMMIDFAIAARNEGKSAREAIYEACMVRFRPIMMTTVAALMAGLPIALGYGAGAESRRPLGLAVVGGLLFSQTLTLYVTPVFYTYMEGLSNWVGRLFRRRPAAAPAPSSPVAK